MYRQGSLLQKGKFHLHHYVLVLLHHLDEISYENVFWPGDLDLRLMTFKLDLDILPFDLHTKIEGCTFVCSALRARRTDTHTHSQTIPKLLHPVHELVQFWENYIKLFFDAVLITLTPVLILGALFKRLEKLECVKRVKAKHPQDMKHKEGQTQQTGCQICDLTSQVWNYSMYCHMTPRRVSIRLSGQTTTTTPVRKTLAQSSVKWILIDLLSATEHWPGRPGTSHIYEGWLFS